MRVFLLHAALFVCCAAAAPPSLAQVKVKPPEPVPVLLGKHSGTLKHVKGTPRSHPDNRVKIYEMGLDTNAYEWGVVEFNFKLGDGGCRAHFGVSNTYVERGVTIRGPMAPRTEFNTGTRYNIADFKKNNKIYVYVIVGYIPLFDPDCSNTFEVTTQLKNYQRYVPPRPYPGAMGSDDYYDFRHKDFIARNPGRTPPDYYKQYGEKYFNRYHRETFRNLSPQGQNFVRIVGRALQKKIEERLRADPRKFAGLERVSSDFRRFGYATHPDAYCESGWKTVPEPDRIKIIRAVDPGDKFWPWQAFWTAAEVTVRCGKVSDVWQGFQ
jgi:hypothetical protein